MTVRLKLPRILEPFTGSGLSQTVEGASVVDVLADLFAREPGLRQHLIDEQGRLRPHVSIFVDGVRSGLDTAVGSDAQIQVLQAVSGG